MRFVLSFIFLIVSISSFSQVTKYRFKVRYEDYSPLRNTIIIVNNQRLSTDDNGIVDIEIPSQLDKAYIESYSPNVYTIKYPVNFQVLLPKNYSIDIDIFVSKPTISFVATKEDLKKLQKTIEQYRTSKDASLLETFTEQSRRMYDSILILYKTKNADENKMKTGRLDFLPLISNALNHYINEAKDLNDAFIALRISLRKPAAYDQFAEAAYSYNQIYELINSNKNTYEQAIASYWNSKELSLKFSNLIEYALEEIHKPYVLKINDVYIGDIYTWNEERIPKKERIRKRTYQQYG